MFKISYSNSTRFMSKLYSNHMATAKRILRYVKGTWIMVLCMKVIRNED